MTVRVGIAISMYRQGAGLARVAVAWARGLAGRGHDVTVFTQHLEREPSDAPIRFVRVGGFHSPIAARAATFPPLATAAVRRASLDVVISFGCTVFEPCVVRLPGAHRPWWELANALAPATSFEGLRRRANPHHRIVLAWERRVLTPRIARAVLAASEHAAGDISRLYPAIAGRVRVVPDGIDPEAFRFDAAARESTRSAWGAGGRLVVLTVATEVRRKGISTLLDAFSLVARERPDALLVVGGTAPRNEVARLAEDRGLASCVRAAGFLPDIAAAYAAADVLVFPTIFDPWGLPVVEALACGTPVAVSVAAGSSQAVLPGETGALIENPFDPGAVARGILAAAGLRPDRDRLRDSVTGFAWPHVIDAVEAVLATA